MRRGVALVPVLVFVLAGLSLGQGQRPNPAEFSHSVSIEGTGKVTITYRSLHWNEQAYASAKQNDQIRERLNTGLWKRIGTFNSDIDLTIGNVQVPKGSYTLGINFDANDNFKLVLGNNGKDIIVPLTTQQDSPMVSYLAFDIRPAEGGGYVIEGRSGKFRSWADVKLP
jgi:hypothetical protein